MAGQMSYFYNEVSVSSGISFLQGDVRTHIHTQELWQYITLLSWDHLCPLDLRSRRQMRIKRSRCGGFIGFDYCPTTLIFQLRHFSLKNDSLLVEQLEHFCIFCMFVCCYRTNRHRNTYFYNHLLVSFWRRCAVYPSTVFSMLRMTSNPGNNPNSDQIKAG